VVRGTSRERSSLEAIEAAGAEAVIADPDRLGTIVAQLHGVSVVCWLLGSAEGDDDGVAALHGPRLRSLLETLVDSPARGLVYEAAGSVPAAVLDEGRKLVREAGGRHRMPVELVTADPAAGEAWTAAAVSAVDGVLTS